MHTVAANRHQTWVEGKPGDEETGIDGVGTIEILICLGKVGPVVKCNPPICAAPHAAFDEKHKKVSCRDYLR